MTLANLPYITRLGLPELDRVHFGMHACYFHDGPDQLFSVLESYSISGLRSNERCLWVAAPPLSAREAVQTLRGAWDGADDAISADALRILDGTQLTGIDMLQLWLDEEARALADGYNGLRIAANMSFLAPAPWSRYLAYEREVTARFGDRRIVTLCSYTLAQCDDRQMSEVLQQHCCTAEYLGTCFGKGELENERED